MDPRLLRPLFGITYGQEVIVGVEPESVAARAFAGDRNPVGARLVGTTLAYGLATARVTVAYPPSSPMARSGAAKAADDGEARWRTLIVPVPAAVREDPLGHGLERGLAVDLKAAQERDRFSFGEALPRAGAKWAKIATMVFSHLGKLVTRDIPVSAMGGPVKLFEIIKGADDRGFGYLLYIVALISINLGICNILPFPVLDGGHCMFLLYEAVVGRPPSDRFREVLQYIGLALILALMLTVTGYDLRDLFGFGR